MRIGYYNMISLSLGELYAYFQVFQAWYYYYYNLIIIISNYNSHKKRKEEVIMPLVIFTDSTIIKQSKPSEKAWGEGLSHVGVLWFFSSLTKISFFIYLLLFWLEAATWKKIIFYIMQLIYVIFICLSWLFIEKLVQFGNRFGILFLLCLFIL